MSERLAIPPTWSLPKEFTSRLGKKAGRQRLMVHEGHLLLILHAVPDTNADNRKAVLFWRNPDERWLTTAKGNGVPALKAHLKSYDDAVDSLQEIVVNANSSEDFYRVLKLAVPLSRATAHLHAVLQKCREHSDQNKEMISLRDEAYEIDRAASLLSDDARNGMDFEIARQTKEQADNSEEISISARRLNIMAAFFLPITAIASILGMNLFTGLENVKSPVPFWIVIIFGLALGFVLKVLIFRSKRD